MPLTVVLSVKSSEPLAIPTRSSNLSAPKATARVSHRDEYYSPDLKLVLMREYRDPGRPNSFVKFDKVYTIGQ